jgi:2-keto-4-pentenoate hydratase/2-oxohepta-3-ene-1,7-dioic acid hydratase in catechol pathway
MKLASFEVPTAVGPARRIGVLEDETIVDITASYAAALDADGVGGASDIANAVTPPDMIEYLRRGDRARAATREALSFVTEAEAQATFNGAQLRYQPDDIRLLAPVPRPNSIRDFMLFEEHVRNSLDGELPAVLQELPIYYKGNPDSVVGPGSEVEWPKYTEKLDYELELCAVIGKQGRDIPAAEAMDYVAGYTIFNDFSARDIQMREMEGRLGPTKGKDFANGFGPYLVTSDEIDIHDLDVRASVNGEVWSDGSTTEMIHSFPEIIEYVSQDETLYPGDVLGTGTVGNGCGLELDRWLERGDTVALEAEGIGTLEHHIVPNSSNT